MAAATTGSNLIARAADVMLNGKSGMSANGLPPSRGKTDAEGVR